MSLINLCFPVIVLKKDCKNWNNRNNIFKKWTVDSWHQTVDSWHQTVDRWHQTVDSWHQTVDRWQQTLASWKMHSRDIRQVKADSRLRIFHSWHHNCVLTLCQDVNGRKGRSLVQVPWWPWGHTEPIYFIWTFQLPKYFPLSRWPNSVHSVYRAGQGRVGCSEHGTVYTVHCTVHILYKNLTVLGIQCVHNSVHRFHSKEPKELFPDVKLGETFNLRRFVVCFWQKTKVDPESWCNRLSIIQFRKKTFPRTTSHDQDKEYIL